MAVFLALAKISCLVELRIAKKSRLMQSGLPRYLWTCTALVDFSDATERLEWGIIMGTISRC